MFKCLLFESALPDPTSILLFEGAAAEDNQIFHNVADKMVDTLPEAGEHVLSHWSIRSMSWRHHSSRLHSEHV